jgi:arylsulfatase A-like enzyme
MTGRYSIRTGLSLIAVAGSPNSLPATEITMAEMLREAGYATAMFGKWHLGAESYSQPQNKGFDEFYGIPPGDTSRRRASWLNQELRQPETFRGELINARLKLETRQEHVFDL